MEYQTTFCIVFGQTEIHIPKVDFRHTGDGAHRLGDSVPRKAGVR